jgi:hypothetical protein
MRVALIQAIREVAELGPLDAFEASAKSWDELHGNNPNQATIPMAFEVITGEGCDDSEFIDLEELERASGERIKGGKTLSFVRTLSVANYPAGAETPRAEPQTKAQ